MCRKVEPDVISPPVNNAVRSVPAWDSGMCVRAAKPGKPGPIALTYTPMTVGLQPGAQAWNLII